MILVDTSVWIDHFRTGDPHLSGLLTRRLVKLHPWVVGELACGNLANRVGVLRNLQRLPQLSVAREHEVLFLIERHQLMGKGIGYMDAHLITAALAEGAQLWTRDKRLMAAVCGIDLLYSPPLA
jgi:predicted nucleic acid-binding protein